MRLHHCQQAEHKATMSPPAHWTSLIQHILANHGWQLVDPAMRQEWQAFEDHVLELLGNDRARLPIDPHHLRRAVVGAYSPRLYAACAAPDLRRKRRGFEELWAWVYSRVYYRVDTPQDAEEVTQDTLLKVHRSLSQVRDPRGFLGFVSVIAFHEMSDYYRRKKLENRLMQGILSGSEDQEDLGDEPDDLADPAQKLEAELIDATAELEAMIYDCMPKKKRRQARVLIDLVLKERTVAELAQDLRTTPGNVYGLYFRAKKGLLEHCDKVVKTVLQHLQPSQRPSLDEVKP